MLSKENTKETVIDDVTLEKNKFSIKRSLQANTRQIKTFYLTHQKIISFINEMVLKFSKKMTSTLIENWSGHL